MREERRRRGIVKDGFEVEIEEEYISQRAEDGIARPGRIRARNSLIELRGLRLR